MEKRINIAELLKDCPQGMELDCLVYDNVTLGKILEEDDYPIVINIGENGEYFEVTEYGTWTLNKNAKCVIFPKGKTTWEGFQRPFKDGDIVVNASNKGSNAFIYAGENNAHYESYVALMVGTNPELLTNKCAKWVCKKSGIRFATEEEKQKLFDAIKENGYSWNAETKTLEKLVNKFDISSLEPFQKLLVRDSENQMWKISMWGCYQAGELYPYFTMAGCYKMCIPYESNEHLLGTTDDCKDFYKTWN
jgi:hypothetical protein